MEERKNEGTGDRRQETGIRNKKMRDLIKTHLYYGIPTSQIPDILNRYIPDEAIIKTYIQTNMFGSILLLTKYISQEQDCPIEQCEI